MSEYKTAIFDLDGVIVDTAKYHYLAWKCLADELGFEFTEHDNERLKGISRRKSLEILLDIGGMRLDEKTKITLSEKKNGWYVAFIKNISSKEILPGVIDFIKEIRSLGIKISLGSASKNARLILQNIGMTEYFDAIVDGNCVLKAKPDPEVFIAAAGRLGSERRECVVFEDAEAGIEAAKSAGMYAVGIGRRDILEKADIVVGGFSGSKDRKIIEELFK
ncbi:beta-phosphoglucomutase [Ruminiclostridium sufflavum DSM 19573]|uniref:Beta-phosphoglucomutase n=1 Tax=Ruminiclostridium sufflavum DSM 19573 TaxID=1121337 RepID=A0A318Y7W6_9FIRM|nr:beta-phosphoglucomutase [Ruminiclostridium sufflavum]PYG88244.1 beta-phosphoglucomutase [Ruminiclostridium sufflavum DSM 19573]